MYLQVFFFGPLHKKERRLSEKPPAVLRYVDADKVEYVYKLYDSVDDGHKLVYVWRDRNSPNP